MKNMKKLGGGGYLVAKNSSYTTKNDKDTCKNVQDNSYFLQQSQNCENAQNNNNFSKKITQNDVKSHCDNSLKNIKNKSFTPFKNSYKNNIKTYSATTKVCLWFFLFVACLVFTVGFGGIGGSSDNGSLKVAPEIETATAAGSSWSGSGTSGSPYLIGNEAGLTALATACNSGTAYSGTYFKLTQDIPITSSNWMPIGFDESPSGTPVNVFSGIFDGAEHTITISNTYAKEFTLTNSGYACWGGLFGFVQNGRVLNVNVKFNLGENYMFNQTESHKYSDCKTMYGGIVGGCQSTDSENPIIQNCSISSESNSEIKVTCKIDRVVSFGGIVGGVIGNGIIDNCALNASLNITGNALREGGIVGYSEGKVTNCSVNADVNTFSRSGIYYIDTLRGGIAGMANVVENCTFDGGSFNCDLDNVNLHAAGAIAGVATTIKNCKVLKSVDNTKKIKIHIGVAAGTPTYAGVIAGTCDYIENCYTNANIDCIVAEGDDAAAGIIAGAVTTVKNCKADVSIATFGSYQSFGYIAGLATTATLNGSTVNPSITNCFIQVSTTATQSSFAAQVCSNVSSGTLTTYNCVFIGVSGLKFTSSIAATAGGTYGLYASSSDVVALKKTTTYAGTGANGYAWNSAAPWDFESAWFIESENETYPTLQSMSPCTVTINVTTSAGAGGVVGTDKYILYKLNSAGAVVNQFVVSHNSEIVFSAKRGEKITLLTTYRSYLYWTVDGAQVDKYQFTPSVDTEINIHIAAPAVINNSIVI